jgi:hypothetical protein
MPTKILFFSLILSSLFFCKTNAQTDSANITQDTSARKNILALDTSALKYNPKVATFRSAVLPGWGQAYNKKYWKIPIVYGALGTTAYIFFYNLKTYKVLRQAIIYRSDTIVSNDVLVDPRFRPLSTESIRRNRSVFRQNVDYSVLAFIILWGLNVVDATVDAHLKAFDVSSDLSLRIKVGKSQLANTTGFSLVLSLKDKHAKALSSNK